MAADPIANYEKMIARVTAELDRLNAQLAAVKTTSAQQEINSLKEQLRTATGSILSFAGELEKVDKVTTARVGGLTSVFEKFQQAVTTVGKTTKAAFSPVYPELKKLGTSWEVALSNVRGRLKESVVSMEEWIITFGKMKELSPTHFKSLSAIFEMKGVQKLSGLQNLLRTINAEIQAQAKLGGQIWSEAFLETSISLLTTKLSRFESKFLGTTGKITGLVTTEFSRLAASGKPAIAVFNEIEKSVLKAVPKDFSKTVSGIFQQILSRTPETTGRLEAFRKSLEEIVKVTTREIRPKSFQKINETLIAGSNSLNSYHKELTRINKELQMPKESRTFANVLETTATRTTLLSEKITLLQSKIHAIGNVLGITLPPINSVNQGLQNLETTMGRVTAREQEIATGTKQMLGTFEGMAAKLSMLQGGLALGRGILPGGLLPAGIPSTEGTAPILGRFEDLAAVKNMLASANVALDNTSQKLQTVATAGASVAPALASIPPAAQAAGAAIVSGMAGAPAAINKIYMVLDGFVVKLREIQAASMVRFGDLGMATFKQASDSLKVFDSVLAAIVRNIAEIPVSLSTLDLFFRQTGALIDGVSSATDDFIIRLRNLKKESGEIGGGFASLFTSLESLQAAMKTPAPSEDFLEELVNLSGKVRSSLKTVGQEFSSLSVSEQKAVTDFFSLEKAAKKALVSVSDNTKTATEAFAEMAPALSQFPEAFKAFYAMETSASEQAFKRLSQEARNFRKELEVLRSTTSKTVPEVELVARHHDKLVASIREVNLNYQDLNTTLKASGRSTHSLTELEKKNTASTSETITKYQELINVIDTARKIRTEYGTNTDTLLHKDLEFQNVQKTLSSTIDNLIPRINQLGDSRTQEAEAVLDQAKTSKVLSSEVSKQRTILGKAIQQFQELDSTISRVGKDYGLTSSQISKVQTLLSGHITKLHSLSDAFARIDVQTRNSADAFRALFRLSIQGFKDLIVSQSTFIVTVQLVFKAMAGIRRAFENFVEIQTAVARAIRTTRSELVSVAVTAQRFVSEITRAMTETGETSENLGEILYQLGSAGLSAEESLAAYRTTLDTIIGTEADVAETTKTVAGIYKNFQDQIEPTGTLLQKFARINDVIVATFRDHMAELNELRDGYKFSIMAATQVGIQFEELSGILGTLQDHMIRAGSAGRGLQNIFQRIAQQPQQFMEAFGVMFDPKRPLDFLDIMTQVSAQMKTGVLSAEEVGTVFQRLGLRGARPFIVLAQYMDEVVRNIDRIKNSSEGAAKAMSETRLTEPVRQYQMLSAAALNFVREGISPVMVVAVSLTTAINDLVKAGLGLNQALGGSIGVLVSVGAKLLAVVGVVKLLNAKLVKEHVPTLGIVTGATRAVVLIQTVFGNSLRVLRTNLVVSQKATLLYAGALGILRAGFASLIVVVNAAKVALISFAKFIGTILMWAAVIHGITWLISKFWELVTAAKSSRAALMEHRAALLEQASESRASADNLTKLSTALLANIENTSKVYSLLKKVKDINPELVVQEKTHAETVQATVAAMISKREQLKQLESEVRAEAMSSLISTMVKSLKELENEANKVYFYHGHPLPVPADIEKIRTLIEQLQDDYRLLGEEGRKQFGIDLPNRINQIIDGLGATGTVLTGIWTTLEQTQISAARGAQAVAQSYKLSLSELQKAFDFSYTEEQWFSLLNSLEIGLEEFVATSNTVRDQIAKILVAPLDTVAVAYVPDVDIGVFKNIRKAVQEAVGRGFMAGFEEAEEAGEFLEGINLLERQLAAIFRDTGIDIGESFGSIAPDLQKMLENVRQLAPDTVEWGFALDEASMRIVHAALEADNLSKKQKGAILETLQAMDLYKESVSGVAVGMASILKLGQSNTDVQQQLLSIEAKKTDRLLVNLGITRSELGSMKTMDDLLRLSLWLHENIAAGRRSQAEAVSKLLEQLQKEWSLEDSINSTLEQQITLQMQLSQLIHEIRANLFDLASTQARSYSDVLYFIREAKRERLAGISEEILHEGERAKKDTAYREQSQIAILRLQEERSVLLQQGDELVQRGYEQLLSRLLEEEKIRREIGISRKETERDLALAGVAENRRSEISVQYNKEIAALKINLALSELALLQEASQFIQTRAMTLRIEQKRADLAALVLETTEATGDVAEETLLVQLKMSREMYEAEKALQLLRETTSLRIQNSMLEKLKEYAYTSTEVLKIDMAVLDNQLRMNQLQKDSTSEQIREMLLLKEVLNIESKKRMLEKMGRSLTQEQSALLERNKKLLEESGLLTEENRMSWSSVNVQLTQQQQELIRLREEEQEYLIRLAEIQMQLELQNNTWASIGAGIHDAIGQTRTFAEVMRDEVTSLVTSLRDGLKSAISDSLRGEKGVWKEFTNSLEKSMTDMAASVIVETTFVPMLQDLGKMLSGSVFSPFLTQLGNTMMQPEVRFQSSVWDFTGAVSYFAQAVNAFAGGTTAVGAEAMAGVPIPSPGLPGMGLPTGQAPTAGISGTGLTGISQAVQTLQGLGGTALSLGVGGQDLGSIMQGLSMLQTGLQLPAMLKSLGGLFGIGQGVPFTAGGGSLWAGGALEGMGIGAGAGVGGGAIGGALSGALAAAAPFLAPAAVVGGISAKISNLPYLSRREKLKAYLGLAFPTFGGFLTGSAFLKSRTRRHAARRAEEQLRFATQNASEMASLAGAGTVPEYLDLFGKFEQHLGKSLRYAGKSHSRSLLVRIKQRQADLLESASASLGLLQGTGLEGLEGDSALSFARMTTDVFSRIQKMASKVGAESEVMEALSKITGMKETLSSELLNKIRFAQGFQTGSLFVPNNMLAFVHRGEAIIPADKNPFEPGNESEKRGAFDVLHSMLGDEEAAPGITARSFHTFRERVTKIKTPSGPVTFLTEPQSRFWSSSSPEATPTVFAPAATRSDTSTQSDTAWNVLIDSLKKDKDIKTDRPTHGTKLHLVLNVDGKKLGEITDSEMTNRFDRRAGRYRTRVTRQNKNVPNMR